MLNAQPRENFAPDIQEHHSNCLPDRQERRSRLFASRDDDDVARAILEGLREFGLPHRLKVPPAGLPGCNGSVDYAAIEVIREASAYLAAHLRGESRTMWNIHERISRHLKEQYYRGITSERTVTQDDRIAAAAHELQQRAANDNQARVYFIGAQSGPIKIGKAGNPEKRLRALQTAHHEILEILATTSGGLTKEAEYHQKFSKHRLRGEWFNPHPAILSEIARLAA